MARFVSEYFSFLSPKLYAFHPAQNKEKAEYHKGAHYRRHRIDQCHYCGIKMVSFFHFDISSLGYAQDLNLESCMSNGSATEFPQ